MRSEGAITLGITHLVLMGWGVACRQVLGCNHQVDTSLLEAE